MARLHLTSVRWLQRFLTQSYCSRLLCVVAALFVAAFFFLGLPDTAQAESWPTWSGVPVNSRAVPFTFPGGLTGTVTLTQSPAVCFSNTDTFPFNLSHNQYTNYPGTW